MSCTVDTDCPNARTCDASNLCVPACVQRLPDGAMCTSDSECASNACVAEFCRTPPLVVGEACSAASHCETMFCGLEETRVCEELPLASASVALSSGTPSLRRRHVPSTVCYKTTVFRVVLR